MRKGFTIIELSIVLVVIGLIIGGILAAQSSVETAKVNAQVQQFQQYDIAVTQFREKFNQLPGDSNLFSSSGTAGDNDGNIEGGDNYGGASSTWGVASEGGNFWRHMSESGSIPEVWGTGTHDNIKAGIDAPAAKIGIKTALLQGVSLRTAGYGVVVPWGEYWMLCAEGGTVMAGRFCSGGGYNSNSSPSAIKPSEALALDRKMDDGKPWSGYVLGAGESGNAPSYPRYSHGGDIYGCVEQEPVANPTTDYRVSNTLNHCNLHVKMFGLASQ